MSWAIHSSGVIRERGGDTTRTVTTYDATGAVTSTRPYTAEEDAAADAAIAAQAATAQYEAQQAADRAALDALAATASAAHAEGEPWVQPTGAHDAYPLGATVTHGGKTWQALIPFCVWEPGVSGWRERVAEGYPAWVQPTGGHDAYPVGAIVTHAGQTWQSTAAANVWQPGVYGWTIHTA